MKKLNYTRVAAAASLGLLLSLPAAAWAQGGGKVRVGPLADEQPAPVKKESQTPKTATHRPAAVNPETKVVKIEKSAEAKTSTKESTPGTSAVPTEQNNVAPGAAGKPGRELKTVAEPAAALNPESSRAAGEAKKEPAGGKAGSSTADKTVGDVPPINAAGEKASVKASADGAAPGNGNLALGIAPATTNNSNSQPVGSPAGNTPANPSAGAVPAPAAGNAKNSAPINAAISAAINTPPPVTVAATSPAPTSIYRVGAGDVLDVRLLNQAAREQTLYTVMAGGLLEYPLAGDPVNVSGMTADEIADRLASILRRRAVYARPQFVVSVHEYASHAVLVSGLVADPGTKILRREAVPLYVVIAEAQPLPDAGRAIVISRATGQTSSVDLSDSAAMGTLVGAGDVVSVQARPREFLYLGGEVSQPGQKDFHPGQTLTQAVLAAGGATRQAAGQVKVSRQGADGRLTTTVYSLKEIEEGRVPDPPLKAGDRVEVVRKR